MKISKGWLALIICCSIIIIDQIIKIWVKTHFYWGEDVEVCSWFHLRFVQNNGMAFGMELGSKLFLTLFRILAVGLLIYYMTKLARDKNVPNGYMACIAAITAGAAGNIVDCVAYGSIFDNPMPDQVAQFVPWGEGYASVFHGMVVDMFYFPLCSFDWPSWLPFVGGQHFTFFDPVFNFADAAITVGMISLVIFYYKYLTGSNRQKEPAADSK